MSSFEVRRYTRADKEVWDSYVDKARNATFLFRRDYMDYHADRFADHSLMIFLDGRLHSLLPAHEQNGEIYSHFGLTYGGLIMNSEVTVADTLRLFPAVNGYLSSQGISKVHYRPIPWIYHQLPSEEDLYAIFWKCGARLEVRNIGTAIFLKKHLRWRKDHRRRLRQAVEAGVRVERDSSIPDFWQVLDANLKERYQATPVHTLGEMLLLKSRFPKDIIQYNAYLGRECIGGLTLYITPQVIHGQYSATNDTGKKTGAMEAVYYNIINKDYSDRLYLDFGSSTTHGCSEVNESLIAHKEGYGGRGVTYDTYVWDL